METQQTFYKIHYELGKYHGCFNGEFDERHRDIWLKHFSKPQNNPHGIRYWAEEVKAEGEVKGEEGTVQE